MKSVFALKIWSEKVLCQYNVNVTNITLIINLSFILITKKHENFFLMVHKEKQSVLEAQGRKNLHVLPFFSFSLTTGSERF